jgi:hypothetical protein
VTTVSATTIAVFRDKNILLRFGAEKESYDQVIKKLIGDAGLKEMDARWNQIIAEPDHCRR